MGAIINYSLRVDKLPKEKFIAGKDGAVFVNLTMSVNDETRYGNNTSIMIRQTKKNVKLRNQEHTLEMVK